MTTYKLKTQTGTLRFQKKKDPDDYTEIWYTFTYDLKDWNNLEFQSFSCSFALLEPLSRTEDGRTFLYTLGRGLIPEPKLFHLDKVPAFVTDIIFLEGTWSYFPSNRLSPTLVRPPVDLIVRRVEIH